LDDILLKTLVVFRVTKQVF